MMGTHLFLPSHCHGRQVPLTAPSLEGGGGRGRARAHHAFRALSKDRLVLLIVVYFAEATTVGRKHCAAPDKGELQAGGVVGGGL